MVHMCVVITRVRVHVWLGSKGECYGAIAVIMRVDG